MGHSQSAGFRFFPVHAQALPSECWQGCALSALYDAAASGSSFGNWMRVPVLQLSGSWWSPWAVVQCPAGSESSWADRSDRGACCFPSTSSLPAVQSPICCLSAAIRLSAVRVKCNSCVLPPNLPSTCIAHLRQLRCWTWQNWCCFALTTSFHFPPVLTPSLWSSQSGKLVISVFGLTPGANPVLVQVQSGTHKLESRAPMSDMQMTPH